MWTRLVGMGVTTAAAESPSMARCKETPLAGALITDAPKEELKSGHGGSGSDTDERGVTMSPMVQGL